MSEPFVLLDDARPADPGSSRCPSPARLYRVPFEIVVARRADELGPALDRLDALYRAGHYLAGHIAYEAGLALELRLAPLAPARCGAAGPLLWFGAFTGFTEIPAAEMPGWLAARTAGSASIGPASIVPASVGPLDPALSVAAYAHAFARLRAAITAGDIYQANLTFPLIGTYRGDPLALYAALRPTAAAGYGGLIHDGSHWLLSLSPELFVALKAEGGQATVKPMKGTRPRHADPAADAAAAAELAASLKDRAENLMIVDLMRNDLSRIAVPGSVRVEAPYAVESYPTVHQMVSTVRARLVPGCGPLAVLRALFPCGSITGAPKIRAMELIDSTERDARGPYCGALGRIDPVMPQVGADGTGDAAFNVAIRTLRLTPDGNGRGENGGGRAVLSVGSAIVADSDYMTEWRECLVKGGFMRSSAGGFDLIETMGFAPETGIALLELHLERVGASAAALGFLFDRHAVRNAIQALCFELETTAKVRLMIARGGAFTLETTALPPAFRAPATCAALSLPVDAADFRLRHKTTDRAFYDAARRAAQAVGADEALLLRDDGLLTEGSFTNLFVERGGVLLTPPAARGLLPGVLRRSLLDSGAAQEADLQLADLEGGFFLGNAVRGLISARLFA